MEDRRAMLELTLFNIPRCWNLHNPPEIYTVTIQAVRSHQRRDPSKRLAPQAFSFPFLLDLLSLPLVLNHSVT
ncbi:hypothetical protein DY000_02025307 [Brassica cretica]|uniref:Uncharacterized protein n=1 Tax=Brassica cretica TaxID=69181 RepID=A0ABQ7E9X8_BRACR|nr:hypothetical protein DY000_02025307 [Brassica cretica]